MTQRRTIQELRAMAYRIADDIETLTESMIKAVPALTYREAQLAAIAELADRSRNHGE